MESFFNSLKNEHLFYEDYTTGEEAKSRGNKALFMFELRFDVSEQL